MTHDDDMTMKEYRELYDMLDEFLRLKHGRDDALSGLHAGGIIKTSRHVRARLEVFETKVAQHAKAKAESERSLEECIRQDYGPDAYDALPSCYDFDTDN